MSETNSAVKRRKRPSLVCENCKRKKTKCDKQQPCSQCIKSNSADSCRYDNVIIKKPFESKKQLPYMASAKTPLNFAHNMNIEKRKNKPEVNVNNEENLKSRVSQTNELKMLKERLAHLESALQSNENRKRAYVATELQYNEPAPSGIQSITKVPEMTTIPTIPTIPVTPNYYGGSGLPNNFSLSNKFSEMPSITSIAATSDYNSGPKFRNIPIPKASLGPNLSKYPSDTGYNNYSTTQNPNMYTGPNTNYNGSYSSPKDYMSSTNSSNGSTTDYSSRSSISSLLTPPNITPLSDYSMKTASIMNGVVPYADESDTINFYENYTSLHVKEHITRVNFGPFSWSSIMNRDMGLRILWDYVVKKKKEQSVNSGHFFAKVTQDITNVINSPNENTEKAFQKRALETDGYTNMVPYNNIIKSQKEFKNSKLYKDVIPLGLTYFEGQINRELQLIDKIQLVLPNTMIIWKHIDLFFRRIYSCFPFLDEKCFRREIGRIIPISQKNEKTLALNVEKKLDLATLGILLIVLRFSYLSLFCNKPSVNESYLNSTDTSQEALDIKLLLLNPINVSAIDVAQLCLDQFSLFRKPTFILMQFALFFRIYHTYAPEDGDGADGGESQVYTSVLIQMAYSLGLNRDPDNFPEVCSDKRVNNLTRKIWHYLLMSDTHQGSTFGNPLSTSDIYYDTKLPFWEEGCSNNNDEEMEKFVLDSWNDWFPFRTSVNDLLTLVLRVKEKTKMPELSEKVAKIELLIRDKCGDLSEILRYPVDDNKNRYNQIIKLKVGLSYSSFLFTIYYYIYLYYHDNGNNQLAFYYLKKIFLITTYVIMPNYFELLGICNTLINPILEVFIHKSNQIYLACILRINFTIFNYKSQPDHEKKLVSDLEYAAHYKSCCQFSSCLTRCAEVSIAAISKISNRYYYAWRITKSHTYLLKTITNEEFYDINASSGHKISRCSFSTEMLQELIRICEIPLSKLGKNNSNITEFCKDINKYSQPLTSMNKYASSGCGDKVSPNSQSLKDKNEFGLDFESCADIDNLWLQMLIMKQENKLAEVNQGFTNETPKQNSFYSPFTEGVNQPEKIISESQRTHVDNIFSPTPMEDFSKLNVDPEAYAHFDIFSELPINDMLNN